MGFLVGLSLDSCLLVTIGLGFVTLTAVIVPLELLWARIIMLTIVSLARIWLSLLAVVVAFLLSFAFAF